MIYAMNGFSGSSPSLFQEMLSLSVRDLSCSFSVKQYAGLLLGAAADCEDSIYSDASLSLICESAVPSCPDPLSVVAAYRTYGEAFAEKLDGRFSICLYDSDKELLFLARSRPGSAPLYYHMNSTGIAFSSSQAVLSLAKNLPADSGAIMKFLAFDGENETPSPFFKDVVLLEPGQTLEYNLKSGASRILTMPEASPDELTDADALRQIFEDAVRASVKGLDTANIFFSGGTDSSAVLSVLASEDFVRKPLSTFSVMSEKRRLDEGRLINEAVKAGGHRQFSMTVKAEDFFEDLPNLVRIQQSPVSSLSIYAQYKLMRMASNENAGTVIDCQGGDELFAGYPYFFSAYFYEKMRKLDPVGFFSENFAYFRRSMTFYPQIFLLLQLMPSQAKSIILRKFIKPWLNGELLLKHAGTASGKRWQLADLSTARRQAVVKNRMPEIAASSYANALACGLRCSMPFMDRRMQEAALSISSERLIGGGESRRIFRQAVSPLLPEHLRKRRDRLSMWLPENELLRHNSCISFLMDLSSSESFKSREFWNWRIFEKELRRFRLGASDRAHDIIRVTSCELFLQSIHRKFR